MVYYFESTGASGKWKAALYMGKHKEENEDLIKYGTDRDVWFHVDNLSSAHVYIRLPTEIDHEGNVWSWDTVPQEVLVDCAQLCKANSITGNKKNNIHVIYTPWTNLKKDGSMVAGQVGFHNEKDVKKIFVEKRENNIINRLNKTKHEEFPDLAKQQQDYLMKQQRNESEVRRVREKEELEEQRKYKELAYQKDHAYDDLFTTENMAGSSNQKEDEDSDDFW